MSGFEVVADQIRASARDLRSAASTVKSADPSGDVGALSAAMPSSDSAKAVTKLVGTWRERFRDWHDDAESQAERLAASAADYDASDYRADAEQRILLRRTGGY